MTFIVARSVDLLYFHMGTCFYYLQQIYVIIHATNGQSIKGFLCKYFVPKGLPATILGLYVNVCENSYLPDPRQVSIERYMTNGPLVIMFVHNLMSFYIVLTVNDNLTTLTSLMYNYM